MDLLTDRAPSRPLQEVQLHLRFITWSIVLPPEVMGDIYFRLKAHGKEVIKKIKISKPFAQYDFSTKPEQVQKIRYDLSEVTPFFTNLHTLFKDPI